MKRILIIEDKQKHIQDAKEVVAKMEGIKADFATNYIEAEALLETTEYFGIVSDIFFPYDDTEKEGFPLGWSEDIKNLCLVELGDLASYYFDTIRMQKHSKEYSKWLEGHALHPSGVALAKQFKKIGQPFIFCTDTYHHGYKTELVNIWADIKHFKIVDNYFGEGENNYNKEGEAKRWEYAINYLSDDLRRETERLEWENE